MLTIFSLNALNVRLTQRSEIKKIKEYLELMIILCEELKNVSHTFFLYLCVSFEMNDDFSNGDGCSDLPLNKFNGNQ